MQIRRHATAVALCELVPLPLLDTLLQNQVRRRLVRHIAAERCLNLDPVEVATIADEDLGAVGRLLSWPVRAVLKKVFVFWIPLEMLRAYQRTVALGEALI